jgi:hypothetical protein
LRGASLHRSAAATQEDAGRACSTLHRVLVVVAVAVGGLAVAAPPASAQATRTWVSAVGDDANPCSRTAPCKTWAGAISKTADGGEIDAMDDADFGAVTITKSITLNGSGHTASALVQGTNGINEQAVAAGIQVKPGTPIAVTIGK